MSDDIGTSGIGTLDAAVAELYALPPAGFVERRTELVAAARAGNNRALAHAIAKLRRPTQVAWLVNTWSRRHAADLTTLADLAAELNAAQRRGDASGLRALAARRQTIIDDALRGIDAIGGEEGIALSQNAVRDIVSTLRAALADDTVLDEVRRGRLAAAAEYSGFGPGALFAVTESDIADAAIEHPATPPRAPAPPSRRAEMLDEARSLLTAMQTDETRARAAAEHAAHEVEQIERTAHDTQVAIEEMTAELSRRTDELTFLRRQLTVAEAGRQQTAAALAAAKTRVAQARKVLDALEE